MSEFKLPASQATVGVRPILIGTLHLKEPMLFVDGDENKLVKFPVYAFLIQHNDAFTLFDLGMRKDLENETPAMKSYFERHSFKPHVVEDVAQVLERHSIQPSSIQHIIFSHAHFDHTGDPSLFPNATLVYGKGTQAFVRPAYPINPDSPFLESLFVEGRTRELEDKDYTTSIGSFPQAHDFFGDGSLYILPAEGHMPGHQLVLAHIEGGFVLLAGDSCHHGRHLTEYDTQMSYVMHRDPAQAKENIKRMLELQQLGVRICLAHVGEYGDFENITASETSRVS